ncbi:MAG: BACON domain-containing carbohydrate-binding protein, partial [Syntrophales bacterium]|nr:BACON domain-containing carbohydrate-binding protein [Syntrophales bacterium]
QNAAGSGDAGYYQGAKETCKSSSSTCNWMESGYPYICRVEIVRPTSATGGLYNYEIKAWVSRRDGITDPLVLSRFQDIIVPYADTACQITKTVSLSEADHNNFSKIFFGFTEATGSSTQQIEVTNFRAFFPQGDCAYSITPETASATAAGGSGSVSLATTTSCPWMTSSLSDWITVTSGSVGAGNGTIGYAVAANTGPARTGAINIVGKTFTVNQADGCVYALSSYSRNFSSSADNYNTVTETAPGNCPWTAVSNAAWITVNSGAGGTGNGTVNYGVAANTGPARTGTMTSAGMTFTVTQDSGCSYSLSSYSRGFDEDADGSNTVSVTAGGTCPWTAASNAAWITINSGAGGTGNGTVNYGVAANTGPARTGTMTIAGRTFTVTQDGGCTYTLSPGSATFGCTGGTGAFTVSASNSACAWTASDNRNWITITSGSSGTGNGTITYTVSPRSCSPGSTRSGRISVTGGDTSTVYQTRP